MTDIVERLREMRTLVEAAPVRYGMTAVEMCETAAGEITALRMALDDAHERNARIAEGFIIMGAPVDGTPRDELDDRQTETANGIAAEIRCASVGTVDRARQRMANFQSLGDSGIKWMERARRAEADVARLTNALTKIDSMSVESDAATVGRLAVGIARTALGGGRNNV